MFSLHSLRNAHRIARFVLVWFALSLGVAIAAPLAQGQGMQLVCSASGSLKVIAVGETGNAGGIQSPSLDCPLCVGLGTPPPLDTVFFGAAAPRSFALPLRDLGSPLAQASAAPPPARGPPALA